MGKIFKLIAGMSLLAIGSLVILLGSILAAPATGGFSLFGLLLLPAPILGGTKLISSAFEELNSSLAFDNVDNYLNQVNQDSNPPPTMPCLLGKKPKTLLQHEQLINDNASENKIKRRHSISSLLDKGIKPAQVEGRSLRRSASTTTLHKSTPLTWLKMHVPIFSFFKKKENNQTDDPVADAIKNYSKLHGFE